MIVVAGTFKLELADRDRFVDATVDIVQKSRAEGGCHRYTFCADPLDASVVQLYELWESEDHLRAHLDTQHYKDFAEQVVPNFTFEKSTKMYPVTEAREVGDWSKA